MTKKRQKNKATHPVSSPSNGVKHSQAFLEKQRAKQDAYIKALIETKGRQLEACKLSDVSFDATLDWRENDEAFNKRFIRALQILPAALIDEAIRRGLEGYETRGVFYKGKKIQEIKEYSDGMLGRLLGAHDARFRPGDLDPLGGDGRIIVEIRRGANQNNPAV